VARPWVAVPTTWWLAATLLAANPAAATTLVRQSLDHLSANNDLIVHAKVLDIHSYWNADHSFILTDVHVRPLKLLKGPSLGNPGDLTFTVMGGTVDDVTVLLVDGPDLVPGSEYVLFLGRANLPGARDRLTVRDLVQGVFEVSQGRAISQALRDPLLPDLDGFTDVPGGADGLRLDDLIRRIGGGDQR